MMHVSGWLQGCDIVPGGTAALHKAKYMTYDVKTSTFSLSSLYHEWISDAIHCETSHGVTDRPVCQLNLRNIIYIKYLKMTIHGIASDHKRSSLSSLVRYVIQMRPHRICVLQLLYLPLQRNWKRIYWFNVVHPSVHPSVRPSVDKTGSALYLPQY